MRLKLSRFQSSLIPLVAIGFIVASPTPGFSQVDVKAAFLKHLKTSRDFPLKVADQMPESTYDFKLTPPQMSFAEQMVHLSQAMDGFLSPIVGGNGGARKPASMKKADVIAF